MNHPSTQLCSCEKCSCHGHPSTNKSEAVGYSKICLKQLFDESSLELLIIKCCYKYYLHSIVLSAALLAASSVTGCMLCALIMFHAALLAASSVTGCMLCALIICFTQRYWLLAVLQAACYVHYVSRSVTGC
jgi:hypothetical protein